MAGYFYDGSAPGFGGDYLYADDPVVATGSYIHDGDSPGYAGVFVYAGDRPAVVAGSYVFGADSPDHAGSFLYSLGGLGIAGALVPTTGQGGRAALLANDVAASGWAAAEVRVHIDSGNFADLVVYDDSSWLARALTAGSFTAVQRVYVDGADQGTTTLQVTVAP